MLKKNISFLFITVVSFLIFNIASTVTAAGVTCDRECLKGFVTSYLDALIAQKPDTLPLSPAVKFTEDCKSEKVGEGLWQSKIKLTDYRRDILDVKQV
jgi:hypothetical protein